MPIKCIIVDDEHLALAELKYQLEMISDVQIIGEGSNGLEAIKLVQDLEPDLIFLDVQMPGLNGFEVVDQLLRLDLLPQVVFVTAYDQYAVKAFEINVIDYLLKPVEKSRLEKAIHRVRHQLEQQSVSEQKLRELLGMMNASSPKKAKLLIKDKNRNILIDSDEILYANVSDGVVSVASRDLTGETNYRTLEDLQSDLDPQVFWRVHRSYLVNINRIKEVIPWFNRTLQLKMNDKQETDIPVSRAHAKRFKDYLKL